MTVSFATFERLKTKGVAGLIDALNAKADQLVRQ